MPKGYTLRGRFPCEIRGCEKLNYRWLLCRDHYNRFLKYGDPLGGQTFRGAPAEWLELAIKYHPRDECCIWPYGTAKGYGVVTYKGVAGYAHQYALILDGFPRPDPPNDETLHSCDVKLCINPDHLRWGTHKENMAELFQRKPPALPRGSTHCNTHLTDCDIRKIRADARPARCIAPEYNVSQSAIHRIKNRSTWNHVS